MRVAARYEGALLAVAADVRSWFQTRLIDKNRQFDNVFLPFALKVTGFPGRLRDLIRMSSVNTGRIGSDSPRSWTSGARPRKR